MSRTSRTGTRTDLALLGVALLVALTSLILPSTLRDRVQGTLRSSVAAPLVTAQAWAERGRMAITDHGRLITAVDSLATGMQAVAPLRAENDRLRSLLGLGQRLQWGFVATEMIHAPRGADEHTALLAAGTTAGVRPFAPVVVPEGLVGMVATVDANSSSAILWTHPDFRASATTTDGVAFGIVAAHLGSGADRFLLEMRGVPFRSELKPGTLIVTSGLGNVFPRGVPIGVVLRETKTVEGWARTYLLRPMVSPDAASAAMILLPPRAAAGVSAAWASATAAEGTQRGITAAGDSILADSVRRIEEQLAKLALLDSLRRAAIYGGDSGIRVESDSTSAPSAPRPPTATTPAAGAAAPPPPAGAPTPAPSAAAGARPGTAVRDSARRPASVRRDSAGGVVPTPRIAPRVRVDSAGAVIPAARPPAPVRRDSTGAIIPPVRRAPRVRRDSAAPAVPRDTGRRDRGDAA